MPAEHTHDWRIPDDFITYNAWCRGCGGSMDSDTAEHILNTHDALVAALEQARPFMSNQHWIGTPSHPIALREIIDTALALAKGDPQ